LAVSELGRRVGERLAAVRLRIELACASAGRQPAEVRLLAVSKGHGAEAIAAAHAAGQREFGENYAQELARKQSELAGLQDVRFRFIGKLQRNKLKALAEGGACIDGLESVALAQALSRHALALGREVEAMIQVNVDREPQKAGVLPEAAPELLHAVRSLPGITLCGLMAIPRASEDPARLRASFRALRELGQRLQLRELSMGMSEDLELAIEEGSTMVRVGTAIFGPRIANAPANQAGDLS
jgi:hypothetical protein